LEIAVKSLPLLAILFIGYPALHLAPTAYGDQDTPSTIDDASRMNATHVRRVVDVSDDDSVAIAQIRSALAQARAEHIGISIAGFRHSLGGQTIAPNGIVLNMLPHHRIELMTDGANMRVQSGAVWKDVILALDHVARSVEVMQSDNNFTVGGSLSVNCHGWQHRHSPIASTVQAMTVLLPNGDVIRCSRSENQVLFVHVLGGYGLFGVILDADLRTVPNERYRARHTACDVDSYEKVFERETRNERAVGMAYGRISVAPASFLREAIVTTLQRESGPTPALHEQRYAGIARFVFRGSAERDSVKRLRWFLERRVQPLVERRAVSRNEILNNDIELYVDHSAASTDILHEYFIPHGKLSTFIARIRPILMRGRADLLNVTVRDVQKDDTTVLAYAREDVFGVVMFFHQSRSASADALMQGLTRELIEEALAVGGTFYLPYRLHATPDQVRRAYPAIPEFFEEKRRVDPDQIFTNEWYLRYGHIVRLAALDPSSRTHCLPERSHGGE
jgi:FAD/FMN-containing dehydrogenase